MFEFDFAAPENKDKVNSVIAWLEEHRGGLSVLVHPNTTDGFVIDHTTHATWLGKPVPLILGPKVTQSRADASPAPSIVHWMQDSESAVCTACQTPFSLFTRRHHCRGCGKLVCASCSPKWAPPGASSGVVPQRTCPPCVQAASA
jgi:hypothetical protein